MQNDMLRALGQDPFEPRDSRLDLSWRIGSQSSSHGMTLSGVCLLILVTAVGGAFIGVVVFGVSHIIYLMVVSPLAAGFIAGGTMWVAVSLARIANRPFACACGVSIGGVICGTVHYSEYLEFRHSVRNELRDKSAAAFGSDVSAREQFLDSVFDRALKDNTGTSGFWGFMRWAAAEGFETREVSPHARRGDPTTRHSGTAVWFWWIFEFAVIGILGAGFALHAASRPFCGRCRSWLHRCEQYAASLPIESAGRFMQLLSSGDLSGAGELVTKTHLPTPSIGVLVHECPSDLTRDDILRLQLAHVDRKGQLKTRELARVVISADRRSDLFRPLTHAKRS